MYLTYDEYQKRGGTLSEAAFLPLCEQACARIDYDTFGRLKQDKDHSDAVRQCCFFLIGLLEERQQYTALGHTQVSGRSNNGLSESYAVVSLGDACAASDAKIEACIDTYLADETNAAGEKLLYRGAV